MAHSHATRVISIGCMVALGAWGALGGRATGIVSPREWFVSVQDGCVARLTQNERVVEVDVERVGSPESWRVTAHRSTGVVRDREYLVTFSARAWPARSLRMALREQHPPWGNLGFETDLNLTGEDQPFEFRFRADSTDSNAGLCWDLGDQVGQIRISDFSMTPVRTKDADPLWEPNQHP